MSDSPGAVPSDAPDPSTSESRQPLPRPAPPRRPVEVVGGWLAWIGFGRLVVTAVCVAVVVAGGYWLVRSPMPPTEAGLPFAGSSTGGSTAVTTPAPPTLPPPTAPVGDDDSASVTASPVVVHVAGAVIGPGVYRLAADARVHTAIEAAGGVAPSADLDGLNLAAPVVDGERIYVPVVGEVDPASVPSRSPSVAPATPTAAGPLDLNRAVAAELESLPGVGPATAAAIIDDRTRNGPFASVDELDRVPGIGPAKLAALRDLVTV